ncbi:hypothetical protein LCR01_09500 [Companilactobacillus crustorum]|uniref:Uncharacterized protein n=2 Tax=Companilactobacillus crustorum TaxID=392416 RepID=A0A837RIT4_9LACO|nr:hypothetical protein [Companilactobacillus crustorum]APU70906.1 hypothetical protein BI355_0554 [Companilactobacillus crustorum]KRK42596.1 hypothetical protein FD26_GL000460 [Companilactobacillus crustorum JCM 15951]KRO20398.1 hypothetical protein IV63_GL000631 [Companilactobacillus crustorum]WDT66033.1 hypothetical protein NV391_02035 [Companilactobacillus crustorum]GEO76507.1 hypothetical protein LCR01_09500 [Companilactobacillus crustorum]
MTDKTSKSEKIDVSTLSKKSQAKLEEIRQKQGLKTIEEAADYLTGFFKQK